MSDPFTRRKRQGQTAPKRPPLPANCVGVDPATNLCRIPKTENAQKAWLEDVAAIQADLEGLAKSVWWSVGAITIPGGSYYYHEEDTGDFGITPEDLMHEGQYDPLASCRAVLQACEVASKHSWYHASEDIEFARFVTFGCHWRKGLERSAYGRVKHNAWRDACYGTLEPSPKQLADVPLLLGVLEKLGTTIKLSLEGDDAITPTDLKTAIDKLPDNWMAWGDLVGTLYLLQASVFGENMMPFLGNEYYPE